MLMRQCCSTPTPEYWPCGLCKQVRKIRDLAGKSSVRRQPHKNAKQSAGETVSWTSVSASPACSWARMYTKHAFQLFDRCYLLRLRQNRLTDLFRSTNHSRLKN
jgi:hypothetical protein